MPTSAPSASPVIAQRIKIETLASQARRTCAGVLDVPLLPDAAELFDRLTHAQVQVAYLAAQLVEREQQLPPAAFAECLDLCRKVSVWNTAAAKRALELIEALATTSRARPGVRTQETHLAADVAARRQRPQP